MCSTAQYANLTNPSCKECWSVLRTLLGRELAFFMLRDSPYPYDCGFHFERHSGLDGLDVSEQRPVV